MRFTGLTRMLSSLPEVKKIFGGIEKGKRAGIYGLADSRASFLIACLKTNIKEKNNILVIVPDTEQGEKIWADLVQFFSEEDIFFFPALEVLPHEQLSPDIQTSRDRLKVLEVLTSDIRGKVIIAPVNGLLRCLMPAEEFRSASLFLKTGQEYSLDMVTSRLTSMNYEHVPMVEMPGEYSVRGGILDIFPLTSDNPVRIEFFGDEIDSIRLFDLATQRSFHQKEAILLTPRVDILLENERISSAVKKTRKDLEEIKNRLSGREDEFLDLKEKVEADLERISEKIYFEGIEQYLPYFFDQQDSLLNYLGDDIVVICSPKKVDYRGKQSFKEIYETYLTLLEQADVMTGYQKNFIDWHRLQDEMQRFPLLYISEEEQELPVQLTLKAPLLSRGVESFRGDLNRFVKEVRRWLSERKKVVISSSNKNKAQKIIEHFQQNDLPAILKEDIISPPEKGTVTVTLKNISSGLEVLALDLIWLTEKEVLGSQRRYHKRAKEFEEGVKITSFEELEVGDYVVHEQHGIGKYLGVKTLEVQGRHQDYLVVKYAGEDRLYVPTDKVHLIQKYIGVESQPPKIYSLGGNEWNRVKKKVQQSVKEMAIELLALYAQRESIKGFAFSSDTVWQKEFEEAFPFEETPDQLEAIKEVKKDMESAQPMDRLICGDVGFGKTEVAIRAAFKAVVEGKQVAMLVPTTILAQQHFNTFSERFKGYPVEVEMLSRFRTRAEQQEILKKLSRGQVDIIIGTHRLLSSDVHFKDLGLLIVDEEQRFGVTHKEKLKDLKVTVDVLTLTATPIPRTLHMALVGIRDLSVIETPPRDRYPIRTYVREYNKELIREAIRRELSRNGQVYFVHNRVEDIDKVAVKISQLVPEARIAVAHGQMSERRLERIMLDFLKGNYDVLVCTTIIETGLDISNVNTILINNADKMGLAQLYQLRGRVGRSNRVAYAYLLYKRGRILAEIAEKRLRAIREFTNLGSGFKIAMRDLEIRGAGNILGPEQHGHIAAVGFSLYCKLLEDEVKKLKGQKEEEDRQVVINLGVDAFLPDEYIPDSRQKIEIYKKISALRTEKDVEDLVDELIDRFGDPPLPVENLIRIGKLKINALVLGIHEISRKNNTVLLDFEKNAPVVPEKIIDIAGKYRRKIKVRAGEKIKLELKIDRDSSDQEILALLSKVLLDLQ